MAENNSLTLDCPHALQGRISHEVLSSAANMIAPINNDHKGDHGSKVMHPTSENHCTEIGKENGDLIFNGSHTLHAPSNKASAVYDQDQIESNLGLDDLMVNGKKINGLIRSDHNPGDTEQPVQKTLLHNQHSETFYHDAYVDDSEHTEKTKTQAPYGNSEFQPSGDAGAEKINCLKDQCDSKSVDVLKEKLEKVSLGHLDESCDKSSFFGTAEEYLESEENTRHGIEYVVYESERQMPDIMRLITKDLSEPYSIYTYRYFIHNWPKLCFLAKADNKCVGAIVCKLDLHKKMARRGYIAMLAVDSEYRRRQIGSTLVMKAIQAMIRDDCDEVVLETEITNQGALHLYENLGFVRDKRLFRYYLNGVDALRLKLWLR